MTVYKQGDVLLVPFPFTDQSGSKQRPSVVVSSEAYNQTYPDVTLAPITSQIKHTLDKVQLMDWQIAGLLKLSIVKPIPSSFDARVVRRRLGTLSDPDRVQVRALFARILDLP